MSIKIGKLKKKKKNFDGKKGERGVNGESRTPVGEENTSRATYKVCKTRFDRLKGQDIEGTGEDCESGSRGKGNVPWGTRNAVA